MMTKYRVGIIGCGRIASTIDDEVVNSDHLLPYSHTASYMEVEPTEVVAAADIDEAKLVAFKKRWGTTVLYTDYEQMLAKEALDIVSVTTRTAQRPEIVVKTAKAGVKAIWSEKPISQSLREADEMIAACWAAGVKFAINCSRRRD